MILATSPLPLDYLTEPEVEKLIKADTAVVIAAREHLDFHSLSNPSSQYLARLAAEATTVINAPDYARS